MKLQNKFEEILLNNGEIREDELTKIKYLDYIPSSTAKECTKLCLEEQIKLLNRLLYDNEFPQYLFDKKEQLQQQLKQLENETTI